MHAIGDVHARLLELPANRTLRLVEPGAQLHQARDLLARLRRADQDSMNGESGLVR
jgi:hypothetical protein